METDLRPVAPHHLRITVATAGRVLRQLVRDRRSLIMIILAPVLLMGLLAWVLSGESGVFNQWGALLLAIFPLIIMFLITSVATLRERTGGTLERLMTMPLSKVDFLAGYGIAFGAAAVVQAVVACICSFGLFGLSIAASVGAVVLMSVLNALLGTCLGLFASAFSKTELQAVQMLPILLLPQFLVCGLFAPTSSMPQPLEAISYVLPMTYAVNAMKELTIHSGITSDVWRDIGVLVAYIIGLLIAGAATLKRRTP